MANFIDLVMQILFSTLVVAGLTEGLTEVLKKALPIKLTSNQDQVAALVIAVALALTPLMPIPATLTFGYALAVRLGAGVLASRGSNIVHDVISVISSYAKAGRESLR